MFNLPRFSPIAALPARFKIAALAAMTALCASIGTPAAQAEPRQAPNSRVALDLGGTFAPSDRFSGFVDEASGASFVIVEMPAAAYEELKNMPNFPEALANQGLTGTSATDLAGRKGEYVYFTAKQNAAGSVFDKFVLILRENGITAMVTANIPQAAVSAGTFNKAQIETVLANAAVMNQPAKGVELFRLGYLGPFKESFGLLGTSKAYSISGALPAPGENRIVKEPTLIVSPSIDGRQIIDPQAAAQKSFQSFGGLKDKAVASEKPVQIGGLKGYQIIGDAVDLESGSKIGIHLLLLSGDPDGYYALVGTSPGADMDKFMPELEKVIASFEPVRPKP